MQPNQTPQTPQSTTEQYPTFPAQTYQAIQQQVQQQGSNVGGAQQQVPIYIAPIYFRGNFTNGTDGYVAPPSAGFSAPQSGPSHQGPPAVLRGMQSTASHTPPQQDINKMQQPTQPMFVSGTTNASGNIRPTQQNNMFRATPSSSGQRAPRHSLPIQQMYPPLQQVVMPYTTYQRQTTSPLFPGAPPFHFQPSQMANFPYQQFYIPSSILPTQHRTVSTGIVQAPSGSTLGSAATQNSLTISPGGVLTQTGQTGTGTGGGLGSGSSKRTARRREHAIDIVHPETNEVIIVDNLGDKNERNSKTNDYQDHGGMRGGDVLSNVSNQQDQLGINFDPNGSNKIMQGMGYVDVMQHHKMGAMSPCSTGYNQVGDMIGPTPIVSAMSDAPSVEIHPKQGKKKSKPLEIVPPPAPTAPSTTEKTGDNKSQPLAHTECIREDVSHTSDASETTTTCSSTTAQSAEGSTENKAIQTKGDSESTNKLLEAISADTITPTNLPEPSSDNKSSQGTQVAISSNQHQSAQQHQKSQTCSQQSQTTPAIQSSLSSVSTPTASTGTSKRDVKLAPSAQSSHSLPPLPPISSISSNINTTNQGVTSATSAGASSNSSSSTISVPYGSRSSASKQDKTILSSVPVALSGTPSSAAPSKQSATSLSAATNANVITGRQNKGKDKHQQQQGGAVAGASNSQNINIGSSTITTDSTIQEGKVDIVLANKQSEKMKLDKDDKSQQKSNNNASNHNLTIADKKDSTNNISNISTSSKKTSDKNENIIPCKTYSTDDKNLQTDPNISTEVDPDIRKVDSSSPASVLNVTSQSRDETDKAASNSTTMPDDNISYYKKGGNNINNNNEKVPIADTKPSNVAAALAKSKTGSIEDFRMQKGSQTSSRENLAIPNRGSQSGGRNDVNIKDKTNTNISNGHAAALSSRPESGAAPVVSTGITYHEWQWSPYNPEGTKSYDKQQLLQLRDAPASKHVSNELCRRVPPCLVQNTRLPQPSMLPTFMLNSSSKVGGQSRPPRISMGGSMSGSQNIRSSLSGINAKNSSKGSKPDGIHISLSLREDVKLNETENAWRPTHLKQGEPKLPGDIEKDELRRRVRGILNKLTPEKFESLVDQILKLQIDNSEKVNLVMELVFEKAVDEPNFSVSYARLCQRLGSLKVPAEKDRKQDTTDSNLIFKTALLDKTENEFSQNVLNHHAKQKNLHPILDKIKECNDTDKKLELQAHLEDEERKLRRRSGGTVRFIGELFKINMLTGNIISKCVDDLLDPDSEEKLECLCKLLETVGKKYELTKIKDKDITYSLDLVTAKMQALADKKTDTKISSRVRFMLQDVIDLRKNKWASSRLDLNPKTMEQIQKEAKTEQISNQYMNYNMMPNKKDDRRYGGGSSGGNSMSFGSGGGGGGGYFNKGNRQQSEDTWYMQTGKGSRAVDTSKLGSMFNNSTNMDSDTRLGNSAQYMWPSFSGIRQQSSVTSSTTNSFAVLSGLESNKNSNSGPRNKGSYNKGSMERDRYSDGVHSRTGSAHGSRESSSSRNPNPRGNPSSVQKSMNYQNYNSGVSSSARPSKSVTSSSQASLVQISSASSQATVDHLEPKQCRSLIEELLEVAADNRMDECTLIVKKLQDNVRIEVLLVLFTDYLHLGRTKPQQRRLLAKILIFLFNNNTITIDHLKKGYQSFCEVSSDIIIDVPQVWKYIFQLMVPLIYKKIITVKDLWNNMLKESKQGDKFLKNLLVQCAHEIGPNYTRELWNNLNLKWTDFLDKDEVEKFIQDNQLQFIRSKDAKPPLPNQFDVHTVMDRVKEMLYDGASSDAINDYISGNIVDTDKIFMRGLTTTLCNYAIQNNKNYSLDQKCFQKICIPLLQRYIDTKEDRELECLYAIQVLTNSLEHPPGLLNSLFCELYESDVVPPDSFIRWRDSKEEPTGKGVAVKGLNPFFNMLLAGETSDENN